jgi:hypothetical protein
LEEECDEEEEEAEAEAKAEWDEEWAAAEEDECVSERDADDSAARCVQPAHDACQQACRMAATRHDVECNGKIHGKMKKQDKRNRD